jgi:hypothetical protein
VWQGEMSRERQPELPNVWHQRRAQRVRCMPGLGLPEEPEVSWTRARVGEVPVGAEIPETGMRMLVLVSAVEEQEFQPETHVVDNEGVFTARGLAVPLERIGVEAVKVGRSVRRLVLGDEEPDRVRAGRAKDASIQGGIGNSEHLAKVFAGVDATEDEARGGLHRGSICPTEGYGPGGLTFRFSGERKRVRWNRRLDAGRARR